MKPDVLISVPTRGSVRWETATALEAARDYIGDVAPILYQPGNLSVAATRNQIVRRFMSTDLTLLAMVDDDVAPPVNFVELLMPFMREYAMVAIPHVAIHPTDPGILYLTAYEAVDSGAGLGIQPKGLWSGINDCDFVATGCVLISRFALEQLGPAPFRIEHDPDAIMKSDDFLFCLDLRAVGLKVAAYWDGQPADHIHNANLSQLGAQQFEARKAQHGAAIGATT